MPEHTIPAIKKFSLRDPIDLLADIRHACPKTILACPYKIQDITAVGAVCHDGKLSDNDQSYLSRSIAACTQLSINVSSSFDLTALNLVSDKRGDFLKHPRRTDLLIICYVYNGKGRSLERQSGRFSQGERHFEKGVWHDAALKSQAKVIVTFGSYPGEVTGSEFRTPTERQKIFNSYKIIGNDERPRRTILLHRDIWPLIHD